MGFLTYHRACPVVSQIADSIGPQLGMSARTTEEQNQDEVADKVISLELMKRKVYPFFHDLASSKTSNMDVSESKVKEFANLLMSLKPNAYIRYLYDDILSGKTNEDIVPNFRWINDIWEQESDFLKKRG